jgi:hypothetical protein
VDLAGIGWGGMELINSGSYKNRMGWYGFD